MKNHIIKSLLIAALVAFTSHFASAEDSTKVILGKVVTLSADQITIATQQGPTKDGERSFSISKNLAVVNAANIGEIEEGTTVFLRVDNAEEVCLVINVKN